MLAVIDLDTPPPKLHALERAYRVEILTRTLQEHGGNRTRAARDLGIERTYLIRLIRRFDIDVPKGARV